MDRNEIIRIAQEAGLIYWTHNRWWMDAGEFGEEIECFAALIAAAEREAILPMLKGIDCTETEDPENGWWETSAGADFGAGILYAIRARGN